MIKDKHMGRRFDGVHSPLGAPVKLPEFDPRIFDKVTGDYVRRGDVLGKQHDSVLTSVPPPAGALREAAADEAVHPHLNLTTDVVVADLERMLRNRGERLESAMVREACAARGWNPDAPPRMSAASVRKFHNAVVAGLRVKLRDRDRVLMMGGSTGGYEGIFNALLAGRDEDPVNWGVRQRGGTIRTTLGEVRRHLGMTVEEFLGLPRKDKTTAIERCTRRLLRNNIGALVREEDDLRRQEQAIRERGELHLRLRDWNAGPLRLEHAQGSSLHHLMDYDRGTNELPGGDQRQEWFAGCQIVVVENDWGAAVPSVDGEWRVPFEFICWEFRISGVRVLAFTEADQEPQYMWLVYGAEGHWVVDDYRYELGCAALPRGVAMPEAAGQVHEFRRVARMCYDTIRASCIMLDAQVARRAQVFAPPKLVERRQREGRAPLRDHYVVRLIHNETRAYVARSRGAFGNYSGDARAPQRGHWRKGTWVHYDDPDSGQVQYANDGGFVVSKTWRRWHFAGDPRNIIQKEYRV